jgi:hypothetical protein
MATFVLTDADVTVNSVDLSDHVQSVEVTLDRETQDDTAMGHTARSNSAGLKAAAITINFLQDFAASEPDATLWSLYDAATEHTVVVLPTSSAVGGTNPSYTLTGFISSYTPIGGSVGDQAVAPVSWVNSSSSGIARATA